MANLTLAIDDELLRCARVKAVQQGTSVNDICREAIERFASDGVADDFLCELRAVAARGRRRARAAPVPAPRDALMDEALRERLPTLMAGR
ncbi:MAG: hypothetical protein ACK5Y8_18040 [Betaproteobacteria bacterium]